MSSDGSEGKPDELTSEDLVSVPGTIAAAASDGSIAGPDSRRAGANPHAGAATPARQSLPSKPGQPVPPAPRKTAPTPNLPPLPPAAPVGGSPPLQQVEGQMIRGPRHGTLVGMGGAPRVDETERLVTGPMSPLDTQRRLVDGRISGATPAADPIEEPSPAPIVAQPPAAAPAAAPADIPPPPADLGSPDSANTVARPPVSPPKPNDAPQVDAPKVVIDAPGAERVISEDLKETQISLRRVQLPQDATASGEHATVIDPARRARGRAIVAAVLGVCGLLLVVGLVVMLVRGHHKDDETESTSTSSSNTTAKSSSSVATKGDDGVAATSDSSAASSTNAASTSSAKSGTVPKGFGRLTVEPVGKTAPANAQIFIGEKSYGPLGQPIFVPCGYRWILAGVPSAKGRLTTRLSKSYSVFVACGASGDTHYKLTLK